MHTHQMPCSPANQALGSKSPLVTKQTRRRSAKRASKVHRRRCAQSFTRVLGFPQLLGSPRRIHSAVCCGRPQFFRFFSQCVCVPRRGFACFRDPESLSFSDSGSLSSQEGTQPKGLRSWQIPLPPGLLGHAVDA